MEKVTLGQYFRSERERLGISLKDIEHRTKIPYQTLVWLEQENLDVLPPRAFLRSFLQVISKEFGMDEGELFRLMEEMLRKNEMTKPENIIPPKSSKKLYFIIAGAVLFIALAVVIAIFATKYWEVSSSLQQNSQTIFASVNEEAPAADRHT